MNLNIILYLTILPFFLNGNTPITMARENDSNQFSAKGQVQQTLECLTPTDFTAIATSGSTAHITWTAVSGATSYKIARKLATSPNWNVPKIVTDTTYEAFGMLPNTAYEYRVSAVCGTEGSPYAYTAVTTLETPYCPAPGTTTLTSATPTTASLSWVPTPGSSRYVVNYRIFGTHNWHMQGRPHEPNVTLVGLLPGTIYQVQIRARCAGHPYLSPYGLKIQVYYAHVGYCRWGDGVANRTGTG